MIRAPSRGMPTPRAASYAPGRPRGPRLPHWLRHAHASHALDRGAAVHEVQQTLGHALAHLDTRPENDPVGPDAPDPQDA